MAKVLKISGLLAFLAGLISALTMLLLGPGYKSSWWDFTFVYTKGFKIVVLLGLLAVALGVLYLIGSLVSKQRMSALAIVGLLLGASAAAVPLQMKRIAGSVPAIHDITTDVNNPPSFTAIAPLRANAPNPITYDSKISKQQIEAYPDLETFMLKASLNEVKQKAVSAVNKLGWELVSDQSPTLIEATETTTYSVKVDVRSKSRFGGSDLGANAARIRKFRDLMLK